jgi:glycosyltransferase involved in cell wall biosynthesis
MLQPQAYTEELAEFGIPVNVLGMSRGVPNPKAILDLSKLLRKQQPDVLHAHMVHANLLARVTRLIVSVPVVICTAHSTYELPTGVNQTSAVSNREWAYRVTDRLCDLTTQVSQTGVERYLFVKATPKHKICFVPNGIDSLLYSSDAHIRSRMRVELGVENQFVWLAVGRFDEVKDYPNLIEAFAKLQSSDALLLIAGQGPLLEPIKSLCNTLNVADRVRFLGVRADIPNVMRAADAFVLSSLYEGMPLVLLEAAATELPIVATNVGGIGELVVQNKTGLLVPPRDAESLAGAAQSLMSLSADERRHMGKEGRDFVVKQYSLESVVDKWESIYLDLLRKKGRAS